MGEIGVLVVDDEQDIRLLVRALIDTANAGLRVAAEAKTGADAIAHLADGDVSVVVLDQMMPDMSGVETAAALLEARPGLPIVLFSAYVDDTLRAEAAAVGIAACVDKIEMSSLAGTVRAVTEARVHPG